MTIRIILKSGAEFAIKCSEFSVTQNSFCGIAGYEAKGITENKPVYLDLGQVAAIVRTYSDEVPEKSMPKVPEKTKFKESKIECPFCRGKENATIFEDAENEEYFVFCKTCGIETKKTYKTKSGAIKAFSEGKTKRIDDEMEGEDK